METKLLLLKAISLVYYRSHTNKGFSTSTDLLLEKVLDHISLPEEADGFSKRTRSPDEITRVVDVDDSKSS